MSFLSRMSFLILLSAVTVTVSAGSESVSFKTQCQRLLLSLKNVGKNHALDAWYAVKDGVADIGNVVREEFRSIRGKDPVTGEDMPEPLSGDREGFFAGCKRRGKESVIPAVLATGSTIATSYLFETIFQTSSRRRNKAVVLPLLILASWYGTHMRAARSDLAPGVGQALGDGVGKRLAMLGVTSGTLTLIISLIKQWTRRNLDNDESLTEEQRARLRKKQFGFRQNVAWSVEVGSMYALAAYLGYRLQGVTGPSAGQVAPAAGGGYFDDLGDGDDDDDDDSQGTYREEDDR